MLLEGDGLGRVPDLLLAEGVAVVRHGEEVSVGGGVALARVQRAHLAQAELGLGAAHLVGHAARVAKVVEHADLGGGGRGGRGGGQLVGRPVGGDVKSG